MEVALNRISEGVGTVQSVISIAIPTSANQLIFANDVFTASAAFYKS
jgi:hypothetical protein